MCTLLRRADVRLVTLTGVGGTGKTRLGLQVAEGLLDQFQNGVFFVALAAISDPDLVMPTIAQTLGVKDVGGQPLIESLKEYLRGKEMMLLVDNFEQVSAAAPRIVDLLAGAGRLKLLITSRAVLHLSGEHEFVVPPLASPDPQHLPPLDRLARYEAVRLFTERAQAAKPDFVVTKENAPAVTEICCRLDGLPLAIELAAARIKLLPPGAMLARMESRLQLLTGGPRDLPARQQTLRGTLDWSHTLLTPPEKKLFRRFSVFVGGCTLEAAEAVCNTKGDLEVEVFDAVASLVDNSLLRQSGQPEGEPRFVMLQTIREYGLERLAASGEEEVVRRAHAAYCLVLAEEGDSEINGPEQTTWLERFDFEHDNFRAALEWLTQSGGAEWGLRLGVALARFWHERELAVEGLARLSGILRLPEAAARTRLRARALSAMGSLASLKGDLVAVRALWKESLEIYRELEDKWGIGFLLNNFGKVYRELGDYQAARLVLEESLGVWRELGDMLSLAHTLSNLADAVRLQGDYAEANFLQEECCSIFEKLGDRISIAWSLNHQGDFARDQGGYEAARSLYEEALAIFREFDDRPGVARSVYDLAGLARDEGDHVAAEHLYSEALSLFCDLGQRRDIVRVLEGFACCASAQGRWGRALTLAGAAAVLLQKLGDRHLPSEKTELECVMEPARLGLDGDSATTAWTQGSAMSLEQAVEYANRYLRSGDDN